MDFIKVIELVKSAKKIIHNHDINQVQEKGEADFVTEIDIAINKYLKSELNKLDSSINFFSEEEAGNLKDPCWILDPIDGTTNLIYGYNMSSISLGLYSNGCIVFGVVYNPYTDECFTAIKGKGAFCNNQKIMVSNRTINKSIIEFGAGSTHKENADVNFELAKDIFKHCVDIRRICSSALSLCFIASGRIDGYFETILKPWDIAAGSLILSEANGKITNYNGEKVEFSVPTSIIASNGIIHDFLKDRILHHIGDKE